MEGHQRMRNVLLLFACVPLLVLGCASGPPPPSGSLLLAQVAHIATKDDVVNGAKVDDTLVRVSEEMLESCALAAESVQSGDLAVVRFYVFWMSRVPHTVHSWAVIPMGMRVAPGDFVELELKRGVEESGRCAFITRVRAQQSSTSAECGFARNDRSGAGAAMGNVSGLLHALGGTGGGSPGSASIYCKGLEQEGWTKHPHGPYDAIVWRKMPAS